MKDFPLLKKKPKKFKKAKPNRVSSSLSNVAVLVPKKPTATNQTGTEIKKQESVLTIRKKIVILQQKLITSLKSPTQPNVFRTIKPFFKKHEYDFQLILFPLILLGVIIIVHGINTQMFTTIADQELPISRVSTTLHPYPFLQTVEAPEISAKAAIIIDSDSQVTLFSKNPQLRFSMASTTKIMTALTALDYFNQDELLTIKSSRVEGAGLGLMRGDQFTFGSLLYAMLLPSANDAALAIADNYPGGATQFVKKMNEKGKALHLTDTHFADPTGLDDDGNYTTVVDMARLASHAIKDQTFVDITSTKYKFINNRSYTRQYPLTNLNRLLGIDGVTGIKTGTTEGAGEVLVTSTVQNGHTYIIVVMQSTDRFYDTEILLSFIKNNVQHIVP